MSSEIYDVHKPYLLEPIVDDCVDLCSNDMMYKLDVENEKVDDNGIKSPQTLIVKYFGDSVMNAYISEIIPDLGKPIPTFRPPEIRCY